MAADFWAGYISGAVGIIIGNPLDILKVRLQAGRSLGASTNATVTAITTTTRVAPHPALPPAPASVLRPFLSGTAAPVLGYGALNALLFVSYNRTEAALNAVLGVNGGTGAHLGTTWAAGAVGGLATWAVSTPTELIKCRAQLSSPPISSWAVAKQVWRTEGIRGLYFGGVITALRDSIGYGFYFWSYELSSRWMESLRTASGPGTTGRGMGDGGLAGSDAARVLLCGGLAGIVTWASIFPLDVVKTRVQAQMQVLVASHGPRSQQQPLLPDRGGAYDARGRLGAWAVTKETYREGGINTFFRGLAVCSVRAFIVNAFQWVVYEWIMLELGRGRRQLPSMAQVQ